MKTPPRMCPKHDQPFDECGFCEAAIAREEDALDAYPDPDQSDREADRFERWLTNPQ